LILFFETSLIFGQVPEFEDRIDLGEISYQPNTLKDISGMAASIKNNNVLWIHNDNDDGTAYAINLQGKQLAAFKLASVHCEDIEDIAIGPGPQEGKYYIYLGDFGDNYSRRSIKYIYRFIEPAVREDQSYAEADVSDIDILKFTYPGDERNAETLIVDPLSSEIYIASKERQLTIFTNSIFQNLLKKSLSWNLLQKLKYPKLQEEIYLPPEKKSSSPMAGMFITGNGWVMKIYQPHLNNHR
jgi:hypothetical protein